MTATLEDSVKCSVCEGAAQRSITTLNHLFIELAPPVSRHFQCADLTISLVGIPYQLFVTGKRYLLRGAICFEAPQSKKVCAIGYYTAYCWRDGIQQWEKYDDLTESPRRIRRKSVIKCQYVVYTL